MMAAKPIKPIPLDYASPGKATAPSPQRAIQSEIETVTEIDAGQSDLERPVALLQTDVHADIEFATRALRGKNIAFSVISRPHERIHAKRVETLYVDAANQESARAIVGQVLHRRRRLAKLPRQNVDALNSRSEGGVWPDPIPWWDGL